MYAIKSSNLGAWWKKKKATQKVENADAEMALLSR